MVSTIKCYNFRFYIEGNEFAAIRSPNNLDETIYDSFEDHYRYGFDSQTKTIKANGFSNYGFFRRLVPLIKINDTKDFPKVDIPGPVEFDTKINKMLVIRKNIDDDIINSLNLDNIILLNSHLSSCYIPSASDWTCFDNNII